MDAEKLGMELVVAIVRFMALDDGNDPDHFERCAREGLNEDGSPMKPIEKEKIRQLGLALAAAVQKNLQPAEPVS